MNDIFDAARESDGWIRATQTSGFLASKGTRHAVACAMVLSDETALENCMSRVLSPFEAVLAEAPSNAPRRRHELVAGRLAAKLALSQITSVPDPRTVSILPGVLGQPVVSGANLANFGVSISHSGFAAVATAFPEACPVGLDIEEIRPENTLALRKYATVEEFSRLREYLEGDETMPLTALWCAKEAMSKLLRCGLSALPGTLNTHSPKRIGKLVEFQFSGFSGFRATVACGRNRCLAVALPPHVNGFNDLGAWLFGQEALLDARQPSLLLANAHR